MNKTVNNCTDCPMAKQINSRYSTSFICNVSEAIMLIVNNEDREDHELPPPTDCPLKDESITITLKTTI